MHCPVSWAPGPITWMGDSESVPGEKSAFKAHERDPLTAELNAAIKGIGEITMKMSCLWRKRGVLTLRLLRLGRLPHVVQRTGYVTITSLN